MSDEVNVVSYTYNLGALSFDIPPAPLLISDFSVSTDSTRVLADYNFQMKTYSGSLVGDKYISVTFADNFKLKYMLDEI